MEGQDSIPYFWLPYKFQSILQYKIAANVSPAHMMYALPLNSCNILFSYNIFISKLFLFSTLELFTRYV